jgi:hypothetical protein
MKVWQVDLTLGERERERERERDTWGGRRGNGSMKRHKKPERRRSKARKQVKEEKQFCFERI